MHIPFIIAKSKDSKAIPILIDMIEKPVKCRNNDLDSSSDEEMYSSMQISRLVKECCLALTSFYGRINVLLLLKRISVDLNFRSRRKSKTSFN